MPFDRENLHVSYSIRQNVRSASYSLQQAGSLLLALLSLSGLLASMHMVWD